MRIRTHMDQYFPLYRKYFVISGLIVLMWTLSGCQSSPLKSFESIKVGMDKSTVVESAGGPTVTRRWKGKDRWIYRFHDSAPEVPEVREVHFEEGRVVYVGKEVIPVVSAEEQDRMNATVVAEDLRRWQEDAQRRRELLGVTSGSVTEDTYDRKLRESMYGLPTPPETEARKRPPTFVPVQ